MVQNTPLRSVTERGEFSLASDIPFRLSILDSFTKSIDLDRSWVWELLNLLKFLHKTSAYLYAIAVINFKNVRSVHLATGQTLAIWLRRCYYYYYYWAAMDAIQSLEVNIYHTFNDFCLHPLRLIQSTYLQMWKWYTEYVFHSRWPTFCVHVSIMA